MAFGILPILHVARLRRSVIATAAVSLASSFTAVTFVSRCPIPLLKRRWARLAVRNGRSGGLRRRLPRRLPGEGGLWARFRSGTLRTLVRRFLVSTVRSLPNAARERPLFRNCYPWCTNRGNSTVRVNSWQRGRRFDAQGCIFMATALGAAQRACDASPAAGCALGDGAKAGAGSGMQHSCERKYP